MPNLTLEQWQKFRRHVQPGMVVQFRFYDRVYEGILLENWPYEDFESWLRINDDQPDTEEDAEARDSDVCLRVQMFESVEWSFGVLPLMRFCIEGEWYTADDILMFDDQP